MAEAQKLKLDPRGSSGSLAARRLRAAGHIPAVLYGHGQPTVSVQLNADDFWPVIRRGARIVDLDYEGQTEKALIRDLQWDVFGQEILHVDFARVAADERITLDIQLELRGTAPGVAEGGVLDHLVHKLTVDCLATDIPDRIRVNVANLRLNDSIHLKDVPIPPGVTLHGDPDLIVVLIREALAPVEEVPAEAAAVEPEVIARAKEEEVEAEPEKDKEKK